MEYNRPNQSAETKRLRAVFIIFPKARHCNLAVIVLSLS